MRLRVAGPHDLPAMTALLGEVYPEFAADLAFAHAYAGWKYFDRDGRMTPYGSAILAEDGGGLAGLIGCLPFRLRRGHSAWDAAWIADWHLAPRARGRGLGRALLAEAVSSIPVLACINGSADAQRLYREAGFREIPSARSFLRIRRPLAFEWPRRRGARRLFGLLRGLAHAGQRPPRSFRCSVEVGRSLSPSEAASLAGRPDGPVHDAGFLEWIARSPAGPAEFRALTENGADVGDAVLWTDKDTLGRRRGRILDLSLTAPADDRVLAAYAAAAMHLERGGADYVDTRAPRECERALRAAGFRPRGLETFWLKTERAELLGPGQIPFSISLLDKDDAFRGSRRVP
jgi:hypothetical protein